MSIVLHGFWRSLATYRVRAALNLKRLDYSEVMIDLLQGEQHRADFAALNPQHALPVLQHDGLRLVQSMPIVEYLDETWPEPPLLPRDAAGRARVRALAQITVADVHPLVVPRVRAQLGRDFAVDEPGRMRWACHWFDQGTAAIEQLLAESPPGRYAHGDSVTLADLALVSHVIGVQLFGADLSHAPRLRALAERCLALDAFERAHPRHQRGAPA
jgi:maleylacetoacetate isomerase